MSVLFSLPRSGTYIPHSHSVFKPKDEEPYGRLNPKVRMHGFPNDAVGE